MEPTGFGSWGELFRLWWNLTQDNLGQGKSYHKPNSMRNMQFNKPLRGDRIVFATV